jgi:LysM repeat protein/ABC-type branched-subunit amino acid transport system substrate-binding protein
VPIIITFDFSMNHCFILEMKKFFSFLIFSLLFSVVFAQVTNEKRVVDPDGSTYIIHEVKPRETVYSLCKQYQIESSELLKVNPKLQQGLKTGEKIKIPLHSEGSRQSVAEKEKKPETFIIHEVRRKETAFFIAKKYGISVDDIYKYNPGLKKIKRGEKLKILQVESTPVVSKQVQETIKGNETQSAQRSSATIEYKVKPDETLFAISRQFGISVDELLAYNPGAQNLRIGMILKLPDKKLAQPLGKDSNVKTEFDYYTIGKGETLNSLAKKFQVTESDLKELNPGLKSGFKVGNRVRIPVKKVSKPQDGQVPGKEIILLSESANQPSRKASSEPIANAGQTQTENKTLGNATGQKVETIAVPEGCRPANRRGNFTDVCHIGLFLPFFLDENQSLNSKIQLTDTTLTENITELLSEPDTSDIQPSPENKLLSFFGKTENYLHFYEGVLLAIDSMRNRGMKVKLYVYDTGQDKKLVGDLVATGDLLNLDLIIGPVFPELQTPISDFAFKNRIPMVSPLSPDGKLTASNPYYFQVFPSQDFLMQKTAQFVADRYNNSNFIFMQTGVASETTNQLADMFREKLAASRTSQKVLSSSFRFYDFNSSGAGGIPGILSKTKENVIFIPSVDEGEVSVAISNINFDVADYDITVIGNSRFKQFESINQEYFHNTQLKFFYPYWTDFNAPATISFFEKFRYYFSTEPSQYSMQGYDVVFFFMSAFWNYGKNFYDCLPYMNIALTQGNYRFEKVSKFGGYMNHGVSLISYNKDFTVVKDVSGEAKYIYK